MEIRPSAGKGVNEISTITGEKLFTTISLRKRRKEWWDDCGENTEKLK
jgi:hypothetical protein